MSLRETLTRRNLPHWFVPYAWHFVTYRLAGTIPNAVLHRLRDEREQLWREAQAKGQGTPALREQLHKQFFAAYDRHLDGAGTVDWLAKPKIAAMIRENLHRHRGVK